MNEKEVKLNQAAVDIIVNNTLSEMLPREQQAYALMVALELAKSEAARQYHSPSKQEISAEDIERLKKLLAEQPMVFVSKQEGQEELWIEVFETMNNNETLFEHGIAVPIFHTIITPIINELKSKFTITKTQNP